MSTDCENLLKKFLVLNPARRASLEVKIMRENGNVTFSRDIHKYTSSQSVQLFLLGDYERQVDEHGLRGGGLEAIYRASAGLE